MILDLLNDIQQDILYLMEQSNFLQILKTVKRKGKEIYLYTKP